MNVFLHECSQKIGSKRHSVRFASNPVTDSILSLGAADGRSSTQQLGSAGSFPRSCEKRCLRKTPWFARQN